MSPETPQAVQLEAFVPVERLRQVLAELAPARIRLGDGNKSHVQLDEPESVDMVAGSGLRVRTRGHLRLKIAGFDSRIAIKTVTLLLRPRLVEEGGRRRLAFGIRILSGDLRYVPALLDTYVINRVNRTLTADKTQLFWDFNETLKTEMIVSSAIEPIEKVRTTVVGSSLRVTAEGVSFSVSIEPSMDRGLLSPVEPTEPVPTSAQVQIDAAV